MQIKKFKRINVLYDLMIYKRSQILILGEKNREIEKIEKEIKYIKEIVNTLERT